MMGMKNLNWFQVKIIAFMEFLSFYNCEKGRHKWGYILSEAGTIYMDDSDVPKEHWKCMNCGERRFKIEAK